MVIFPGKIHFLFGVMVLLTMFCHGMYLNPIIFLIATLLPDCDIKGSPASRFFPLHKLGLRHRGCTHTLEAVFCGTILTTYFTKSWEIGLSFAFGYLLHLCLDACTPMGIKFFGGHKGKRIYRKKRTS